MLSIETEARVAKILLTLAEGERSIEVSRQVLSDNFDFDPYQIFRALDSCCKNNIDTCDIINFLRTKGIYTNEAEVALLILAYDEDSNGTLSYSEFLNLIQSENSPKKNNAFSKTEKLSFNIEYSLGKLLEKEIELSRNLLPLLQDLKCRYDFNIHDIYHLLKDINSITPESLKCFLDRNCVSYLDNDINNIMKRLDINKDGRVDLCEFHSFLGFPECSKLSPTNVCCVCGCCCCNCCDPCCPPRCIPRFCPPLNQRNFSNVGISNMNNVNVGNANNVGIGNVNNVNNSNVNNVMGNDNISDSQNNSPFRYGNQDIMNNNFVDKGKMVDPNLVNSQKSTYFKTSGDNTNLISNQISPQKIQQPQLQTSQMQQQSLQTPIMEQQPLQTPIMEQQPLQNQIIPNQQTQSEINQPPINQSTSDIYQSFQNQIPQKIPQMISQPQNQNISTPQQQIQSNIQSNYTPFRQKISPHLSLRLSPERKYPPNFCCYCRCNPCCCIPICQPMNQSQFSQSPISQSSLTNNNMNNMNYNNINMNNMNYNNMNNINNNKDYNPNDLEECQINDYLKEVMNAESKLEQIKIDLALKCDFNVEDAFRIFENCGRGYLTHDDLKCGLNILGICASDADVRLLMKRFDLQKNCCLNFTDFFDMLVPFEKDYRNMVENRNPNTYCPNNCPDIFMFQTRNSLKNVFNALIDFENKLNLMKRNYTTLRLKLKDIFNLIDPCCLGSFKSEDLDSYLKKKGIFSNPKDEDLLFIRLDKNRDGKVDYCEFEDELQPQY